MALNRATDRFLFTLNGNVLKAGGSLNLAKGQLGIFDIKENTRNGLKAVSNFAGLPKSKKFEIKVGVAQNPATRTGDSYPKSTRAFSLADIERFKVHVPNMKKKVDELLVGYDGINDDTALTFETGDSEELDIEVSGDAIGALGFPKSTVNVKLYFDKLNDDETDQEIVEDAVERAKRIVLVDNIKLSEFVDIIPVNSENGALAGTSNYFYNLALRDEGNSNSLGEVQAQYNDYRVVLTETKNGVSTYTIVKSGAAPTAFNQVTVDYLQTCENCPSGYTSYTEGFLYSLKFQDDGVDESASVEGLSGFMAGTDVTKTGQDGPMGTYLAVFEEELTLEDINVLAEGIPTLQMELIINIKEACERVTTTAVSWVQGKECYASTEDYFIQLKDDECGNDHLDELQAKYPDLNVVVANTETAYEGGCQTLYKATVVTDLVCEECDDIIQGLFVSEAPAPFRKTEWTKKKKTYDPDAKMGILFRAKETKFIPGEGLKDAVPFIHSSVRLAVAGGYNTGVYENFKKGQGRFAVKLLSAQEDLENLGGNLWVWEDRDNTYFRGYPRIQCGNGYENEMRKQILGEESVIKADAQYILYTITVRPETSQNPFVAQKVERFNYIIPVEVGKHHDVEELLNSLAGAAGLPGVHAVIED